jgi:lipoprotein-anchoring transpeptidase ErfK/SrfK
MHNPKRFIPPLILLAGTLISAGCAHQPRSTADRLAPERTDAEPQTAEGTVATTDNRADNRGETGKPAVKPEKDLRYRLPPGHKRALTIYLGSQSFDYVEDDLIVASGQVSTGTPQHPTPTGDFRVLSKDINKRSGKYTNSFDENTPMPYSLQFTGPYFVHEGWVPGRPDSHGCVRLHYEDAKLLFSRMRVGDRILVKGKGAARPANPWPDVFPVF